MAVALEKISCFSSKGKFFFFAYAMDMDDHDMKVRCPSAIKRAVACLCNHKLVLKCENATASFEPSRGHFVWGVVWELDYCAVCSPSPQATSILVFVQVMTIDGYTVLCGARQAALAARAAGAAAAGEQLLRLSNAALRAQLPPPYILGLWPQAASPDPDPDSDPDADPFSDSDAESLSISHSPRG